jgi:diguanylate cyclase (GGDEF)-like protein
VIGGLALIGPALLIHVLLSRFPTGSSSAVVVADVSLPLMEAAALTIAGVALARNWRSPHRSSWLLLCAWLAANLFADLVWGWYEVVLRRDVPVPSPADVGYLMAYPLAFLTVVVYTCKALGRLRALETALDALMVTVGAAGLMWPLLLAPLVRTTEPGAEYWITLAYPLGDLLVIMAIAFLMLGCLQRRLPRFMLVLLASFLVQVVADSLYFVDQVTVAQYTSGGALDSLWVLTFAVAGVAAVVGLRDARIEALACGQDMSSGASDGDSGGPDLPKRRLGLGLGRSLGLGRMLLPYLALPIVGVMLWLSLSREGVRWNSETQILVYLGILLLALMVARQYVTLAHNRRLNLRLSLVSEELEQRVDTLADLSGRLGTLNAGATQLNSLRSLSDALENGIRLACSVTGASAGWVSLTGEDGVEEISATVGVVREQLDGDDVPEGARTIRLEAHGESIGTLAVLPPALDDVSPDLLGAVAAQLAIAIDNIRRFEDALRLAERDPLTGLFNHRGIHRHLTTEADRVQDRGISLSVIMIDLDDFKLLNDTYGHAAGDRVLTQVSEAISGSLRHTDLAGRVGGDEILLVLPETDKAGAVALAERIRESMEASPFVTSEGLLIPLRLSLGVATYPDDARTLPELLGAADANLYTSKQRGGNTITAATPAVEQPTDGQGLQGLAIRLMDVVGSRDHYTRRHSEQVVIHALDLGETLGLSEDSLETLRLAAMLHDVGKIRLSDRLLRKPGPLGPQEALAMQRHVEIGESMIRDLPRVAEVLNAVRSHHERYDGTGYPDGLHGDDIPLLARILAVADAFTAMTLDRPYRGRITAEQARARLAEAAGSQLDPDLVSRFLERPGDGPCTPLAAAG